MADISVADVVVLVWKLEKKEKGMFSKYLPGYFQFTRSIGKLSLKSEIEWSYDHAALDSSSFMKMNFFWNFMTANIGYHHVHHMNSRIPFYRLPEAMKAIPELQKVKITTLRIKDIVACFQLKVWDPQLNKMTGVPLK